MYNTKGPSAHRGNGTAQAQNRGGILGALHTASMIDARASLPAEILVLVLEYLPVADQIAFARASRRMQEMVYDDTRWVARLRSMGCWDEVEARRRFDEALKRRREAAERANGAKEQPGTLFDASVEEQRRTRATSELKDGFQTMTVGGGPERRDPMSDPDSCLDVFKSARSIRGGARQEYGKIYGALAPFYLDIVKARTHAEPIVFKAFRDPEKQAKMLANLVRFARSDWADGAVEREDKLGSMARIFEGAVLREFEQGYEFWDVDGRMKRYAHVLHTLGLSSRDVDTFTQKHPMFSDGDLAVDAMACLGVDSMSLEPSRLFFEMVLSKANDQAEVIARIFPEPLPVFWALIDKVKEDIIMEYVTPLCDEAHERSIASYLKAVSGLFEQTLLFFQSLTPPGGTPPTSTPLGAKDGLVEKAKELTLSVFEPHLDLYLQDELEHFTTLAEQEVSTWERKLEDADLSLETMYMSNINRTADKSDFLSSFRKVVMMPVTALPSFPLNSPFSTAKPPPPGSSRTETPSVDAAKDSSVPTDELAAKAAIMTSKLEGIKSLFSLEVALDLTHTAKASIGRSAVFIRLGGQAGGEAREQCANMFVTLLRILGTRHVKPGFDRAVDHLSHYNPREVSDHNTRGVAPLVTFIELVNVGDLISQMVDVFYEQQLAGPKIADKNDFLDPSGLAKKKFEQMLDESVAAGLNKGIDVLMDEVEYLQGTMQAPTDYNPDTEEPEVGPTPTATRIVDLVASHTKMLHGTTDKSMLDVFNGEVGLRLFTAICKHLKRQRISTSGAIKVIADMNLYADYARSLKNADLLAYFRALKELGQIFLIDAKHARDMASVIADGDRFAGVFRAEEVYEFAQRRADWYVVRKSVERAMYGLECAVM